MTENERLSRKNEIMELYELNEKQRQLNQEEYLKIKNYLVEEMKSFMKDTGLFRKDFKLKRERILNLRDELKGNIERLKDIEKKLKEVLNSDGIDLNYCVQVYKEVQQTKYKSNLIDKVFNVIFIRLKTYRLFQVKKTNSSRLN